MSLITNHKWYAVRLRSHFEYRTTQYLEALGYSVFHPTYSVRRKYSDRVKDVLTPLFPGYLFCRFDAQTRLPILMAPGVVGVIGNGHAPVAVPDEEIARIQEILKTRLAIEPWPFLNIGDKFIVSKGPLAGIEGIIVQTKGRYRLIASVTLLRRSIAAELDRSAVMPVVSM